MTAVVKEEKTGVSLLHLQNKRQIVACKSGIYCNRMLYTNLWDCIRRTVPDEVTTNYIKLTGY
jgi:hypothetical protein